MFCFSTNDSAYAMNKIIAIQLVCLYKLISQPSNNNSNANGKKKYLAFQDYLISNNVTIEITLGGCNHFVVSVNLFLTTEEPEHFI